ncbi:hypothetical protein ACROYT_G043255 [Oculina patagonica]
MAASKEMALKCWVIHHRVNTYGSTEILRLLTRHEYTWQWTY